MYMNDNHVANISYFNDKSALYRFCLVLLEIGRYSWKHNKTTVSQCYYSQLCGNKGNVKRRNTIDCLDQLVYGTQT